MPGEARIGCSGWSYRDWRGVVYPADAPPSRWFELYAERFDTVEINNTFYRLPRPETVEGWARRAAPGFTYTVKLGQFGSHRMKLRDAERWLPNHLDRVQRLGAALGPNLVQLPPRWRRDPARLDAFLTAAPTTMRWAVEVRDRSWLHDDVYDVLARHGAALVVHDLLADHPWLRTTDWAYLRFHGPGALDAARTTVATAAGDCGASPTASRSGSTAATSTPTSTTTTRGTRSPTPPGCVTAWPGHDQAF